MRGCVHADATGFHVRQESPESAIDFVLYTNAPIAAVEQRNLRPAEARLLAIALAGAPHESTYVQGCGLRVGCSFFGATIQFGITGAHTTVHLSSPLRNALYAELSALLSPA